MNRVQLHRRGLHAAQVTLVLCIVINAFSSFAKGVTTTALWQGDKKSAVSITLDDGLHSQFQYAFPILQQHGFKATFYIISGQADVTSVQTLAAAGHEIGSHTVTHPDLTTLSYNQQVNEMSQSQLYLQQLTGQKVDTIAYPDGAYNTDIMNLARNYYIAARSVDSWALNGSSPTSDQFYKLVVVTPHDNGSGDDNAIAYLKYCTDRAVSGGKWSIEVYHSIGVNDGYDLLSSQAFGTHMDYLSTNEPNLWVAPLGSVSEYIYERNAASITTIASDSTMIQLNLHCGLDSRFTTPLTLLTDCPAGWTTSVITVTQGQSEQTASVVSKNGKLYIKYNAVPDAGTIELSVNEAQPIYYTITASADTNGDIDPSGTITKLENSSQLFTATPHSGYLVDKWFVDGVTVQTGGNTYNLTVINANHTVNITFKASSATVETTTALWQGDKKGAVSLTLDDELSTQFQYAFPILKQHGIKATFYIVTSEDADPTTIRTIAADGQEIGSHSVTHPELTTLSSAQVINELSQSQSYLQQASGQKVATFAYPYGDYNTNVINLVKSYYISARSAELDLLNSSSPTSNELYTLSTVVPYQNGSDDASVIAYLRTQADMAVSQQKWAIETFHGIQYGYEPVTTKAFGTHLDYLVANEPNIWVAPMGEVSEYIYERNAASITVVAQDSNAIKLNLHCGLDSRFTTPLTLLTDCPPAWASQDIQVTQGQTSQIADVISKNGNLYMMYDAVPDAGTIELSVGQISPPTNYTITASAGSNGTINPSGSIQEAPGSSQLFTATPNAGYAVDKWSLDGSNIQTGGNTFTLNNIQANHTVSVTFGILPPAVPASITYPATSSTGQYTVSWASSTGATSYQLERSSDNGSTWAQVYLGPNTSYSENIGNGSYMYHVRAANALGSSGWTTGTGNCVVAIKPQPPISISYPADSNTGQYTVSWSSSTGATSYQLARSSNGGTAWSQIYSGTNTSRSEKLNNGNYRYRVRATNTGGSSAWTTGTFDCVVVIPPPPAPTSITYPANSNTGQYTVSWSSSTGAASYQLERSSDGGTTWTQVYSGANTSRSQSVGNGSYRYRVKAIGTGGSSAWTTGTFDCVVLKPPTAPTGVSASDGTFTGKVQVTWNVSNTATSYEVWRNTRSKSGSATKIAEVTTLTYDDTSVTTGTTYWYWVKAKNSAGTSDFSSNNSGRSM